LSGGTFTGWYYALNGDRIFQDFEPRFLRKDWDRELRSRILRSPRGREQGTELRDTRISARGRVDTIERKKYAATISMREPRHGDDLSVLHLRRLQSSLTAFYKAFVSSTLKT
jgi:hypothetical protein